MTSPADRAIARRSNLFAAMPPDVADGIMSHSTVRAHDRGETIFLQGEKSEAFFIVVEGWIKLYRIAPNGAEAVVACFCEGQSFGEAVALQRTTYPVAAEAVTDCRLMHVRAAVLFELLHSRPELTLSIMATLYQHFQALVAQIEQLKAQTGSQRVAEFLLELCGCETGSCTVRLPYDKVLIAGRLGMKPESLSRAFARLRKAGVVVNHSNAAIADVERLRAFAAEDPAEAWSRVQ